MLLTIHDANLQKIGFIDNEKQETLNFYDDTWTPNLETASSTFEFTVSKKQLLSDTGNKHLYNQLNERSFVSFKYKGKTYLFNIMKTEENERWLRCYCENLNLELINEYTNAYKADRPRSFAEYLDVFEIPQFAMVKIGVNEISDQKRTLEWEGQDTKLARLLSLANKFDAEVEFVTQLNDDSSIKQLVLNVYHKADDSHTGVGRIRGDIRLAFEKNIKSMTRKVDKTEIYTLVVPYGKSKETHEGEQEVRVYIDSLPPLEEKNDNGIVIFKQEGVNLYAPHAANLYPSTFGAATQDNKWIRKDLEVDSDDPNVIRAAGIANLRKHAYPAITYEVDGFLDVEVGDTVTIHDKGFTPPIDVKARVVEQKISFSNPANNKTVFGNFKELENRTSADLRSVFERMVENSRPYTIMVSTDNGVLFKNNTGRSTISPTLKRGNQTVPATYRFVIDGSIVGSGLTYTVRASDIVKPTVLSIAAWVDDKEVASEEVTFFNVSDGKQGPKGDRGDDGLPGKDGVGIRNTTITYAQGTSGTVAPTNGWSTQVPNVPAGQYLWTKTVWDYTDNTSETGYSVAKMGEQGPKGDRGERGLQGPRGDQGIPGPKGIDGTDAPTIFVKSYTYSAGSKAYIKLTGPNAFEQTLYYSRGHNVWVLDATTHKLKEFVHCDTYITMSFNHNGVNITLADYLNSITDSIVAIAAADADAVDQNFRDVLNKMGGNPELGTWSWRTGHVFIGMSKRSDGTWPLQPRQGYEVAIQEDGSAPEIGCTLSIGGIVANGADGKTQYTHIAYANSADGSKDFSTSDSNRAYIGMYVDFNINDSTNPSDYSWTLVKGADGTQGVPGKPGADGKTPYFHTAWAYSADGTDRFSTVYPNLNLLVNSSAKTKDGFFKDFDKVKNGYGEVTLTGTNTWVARNMWDGFSMKPRDYKPGDKYTMSMDVMFTSWNLPAGTHLDEFWIGQRYTHGGGLYLWKRICFIELPKDPSKMLNQWIKITQTSTIPPYEDPAINTEAIFMTKFTGPSEGSFTIRIRNPKQEQGEIATPYMPSASEATTADYPSFIGQYTNYTQVDSPNPRDYTWSLIRGNDGKQGPQGPRGDQGIPGIKGADGRTQYTHIAYADTISGSGFSQTDVNKPYIGMYQDFNEVDSNNPQDYRWTKWKGSDGKDGIPGKAGEDGRTPYVHFAYADSSDGRTGFSLTQTGNKRYLGVCTNFIKEDSTNPADYTWSDTAGSITIGGENLIVNSAFPENLDGWGYWETGLYNGNLHIDTHGFYYNGARNLFRLDNNGNSEVTASTKRFPVKRNTDYSFNIQTFATGNIKGLTIYFLGRKANETDKTFTEVVHLKTHTGSPSTTQTVKWHLTFNSGDCDEGYIRIDNNGTTDGKTSMLFFAELDCYEGTTDRAWQASSKDLEDQIDTKADDVLTQAQLNRLNETNSIIKAELDAKASLYTLNQWVEAYQDFVNSNNANRVQAEKDLADASARVTKLENNLNDMSERWNFIDSYMTASNEGLVVGKTDNSSSMLFSPNGRISMFSAGHEVMYISQGVIHIENGIFSKTIQIGRYREEQDVINPDRNVIRYVGGT